MRDVSATIIPLDTSEDGHSMKMMDVSAIIILLDTLTIWSGSWQDEACRALLSQTFGCHNPPIAHVSGMSGACLRPRFGSKAAFARAAGGLAADRQRQRAVGGQGAG